MKNVLTHQNTILQFETKTISFPLPQVVPHWLEHRESMSQRGPLPDAATPSRGYNDTNTLGRSSGRTFLFYSMCEGVCLPVSLCTPSMQCPWKLKEGIILP